MFSHNVPCVK